MNTSRNGDFLGIRVPLSLWLFISYRFVTVSYRNDTISYTILHLRHLQVSFLSSNPFCVGWGGRCVGGNDPMSVGPTSKDTET